MYGNEYSIAKNIKKQPGNIPGCLKFKENRIRERNLVF